MKEVSGVALNSLLEEMKGSYWCTMKKKRQNQPRLQGFSAKRSPENEVVAEWARDSVVARFACRVYMVERGHWNVTWIRFG